MNGGREIVDHIHPILAIKIPHPTTKFAIGMN